MPNTLYTLPIYALYILNIIFVVISQPLGLITLTRLRRNFALRKD